MTGAPQRMLTGDRVYRVEWVLGADRLRGTCWCGAAHEAEDPIVLWEWLLAHPDTHGRDQPPTAAPRAPLRPEPVPA